MRTKNLIHPGEILQEEFLVPLGISQTRLALDLHVPAPRINAKQQRAGAARVRNSGLRRVSRQAFGRN